MVDNRAVEPQRDNVYNRNTLNEGFYNELLYIMGLEETKNKTDKVVRIQRLEKDRQSYSLLEQTIRVIVEHPRISDSNELFENALGLVLTWVNRLLFLKLLEAQLSNYQEILTCEKIKSYNNFFDLFLKVLARPSDARDEEARQKFQDVPYLYSSLFEYSKLESDLIPINCLSDGDMDLYPRTILKDKSGRRLEGKINSLKYLLDFLNAYSFGSDTETIDIKRKKKTKTIITAPVLGLVFEKINGYKDGAYFTPSYITEYMSREAIRRVIVDKFCKANDWDCKTIGEVATLIGNDIESKQKANAIVNSITICDPAVGSGHFLVSALNELMLIKYELGILMLHNDAHDSFDKYELHIVDDELVISNPDGFFRYNPADHDSYVVQKTIFEEKKTIIENCLFGVDINPKSVEICHLRLWIELLKNAYYENGELQTLPNIDINIKCGNSLLSKFDVNTKDRIALDKRIEYIIPEYKAMVKRYKTCNDKHERHAIHKEIEQIRHSFEDCFPLDMFGSKKTQQKSYADNTFEWLMEFPETLSDTGQFIGFDIITGNPPYIPLQKLGDESKNYGRMVFNANNELEPLYQTYNAKGDIYSLFYERGLHLLKQGGLLCFITSNKWMRTDYGKSTRRFLLDNVNPKLLIDFPCLQLFDKATVETNILLYSNEKNLHELECAVIDRERKDSLKHLYTSVAEIKTPCNFNTDDKWIITNEIEQSIQSKIDSIGTPLADPRWGLQPNFGIKTGNNDAFVISSDTRTKILSWCRDEDERVRTSKLLRPLLRGESIGRFSDNWDGTWLVASFPSRRYNIDEYPAVRKYFLSFAYDQLIANGNETIASNHLEEYCKQKLNQSGAEIIVCGKPVHDQSGKTIKSRKATTNKWYETQDNISYWREFKYPKILWKRIGSDLRFTYDDRGFYGLDSTCIMTGRYLKYICCILNSSLGHYLISRNAQKTGTGDLLVSVQAIKPIRLPLPKEEPVVLNELCDRIRASYTPETYDAINQEVYRIYNLTDEEIAFISKF